MRVIRMLGKSRRGSVLQRLQYSHCRLFGRALAVSSLLVFAMQVERDWTTGGLMPGSHGLPNGHELLIGILTPCTDTGGRHCRAAAVRTGPLDTGRHIMLVCRGLCSRQAMY